MNSEGSLSIYLATELQVAQLWQTGSPFPTVHSTSCCVSTARREVSVTILMSRRLSIGDIDLLMVTKPIAQKNRTISMRNFMFLTARVLIAAAAMLLTTHDVSSANPTSLHGVVQTGG